MGESIKIYKSLKEVIYYTLHADGKTRTEFNDFLYRMSGIPKYELELRQLINFVFHVGEHLGAVNKYFKTEDKAFRFLIPGYIDTDDSNHYGLRLYCLPISERIVFLFNGCAKTAQKVLDCPNCSYHFRMANLMSQKIIKAIQSGFISINKTGDRLDIDEDFNLS